MDLLKVAKAINLKIVELDALKETLSSTSHDKARFEAEYDKQVALTIIGLRNGLEYEINGNVVVDPPVSIIDKLAKGLCWKAKLDMDSADVKYRNTLKIIDVTQSQMLGYQSINRYLSEV